MLSPVCSTNRQRVVEEVPNRKVETSYSMRRTKPSRICKRCGKEFLIHPLMHPGRTYNLATRRLCLICSPYRSGIRLLKGVLPTCTTCGKTKTCRSRQCDSCRSKKRRWSTKLRALKLLGGKCSICGWDKHPAGLAFHHPNDDKNFGPATIMHWSWAKAWKELRKCIVLCACCHCIEHCEILPEGIQ